MTKHTARAFGALTVLTLACLSQSHAATEVDSDAAKALFKKNDCTKCHAAEKAKKGPSLKKIAERLKADGQEKVIKNITTGPTVKLEDGSEEEHKIIDTKDPKALKNLADWIMKQ